MEPNSAIKIILFNNYEIKNNDTRLIFYYTSNNVKFSMKYLKPLLTKSISLTAFTLIQWN